MAYQRVAECLFVEEVGTMMTRSGRRPRRGGPAELPTCKRSKERSCGIRNCCSDADCRLISGKHKGPENTLRHPTWLTEGGDGHSGRSSRGAVRVGPTPSTTHPPPA
ncbi:hypothetical protein B296_00022886 [Ensete ventricosum]|uniref:Uncharacterized protein n=1 Tax=Ensete ventricosum TaxID=4639 RepID=A0A427A7T6_ENSVE|nr:hypothetical protein B296_00022886 [Ensete ventricosum]